MENFLNLTVPSNVNNSSFFGGEYSDDLIYTECANIDSFESLQQFLKCFKHFISKSILISCLVLAFSFSTVILNLAVILFINRIKNHKTVFDKIFIGHCIVDGLVGLLVIPNYCIYFVFGYWPLGKLLCHFYVSLDYTICHVGILHMVFVAYARLRSLQSPKKYHKELIISHAKSTMIVLWIISGLLWLPAVNLIINLSFKNRECYFNYDPVYIIIQDTVAYLLPMLIILAITAYILRTLHLRNKRRRRLKRKKNMRLPKLIMQEKKKAIKIEQEISRNAQTSTMVLKMTENFSTSDVSEYNSDGQSTVPNEDTNTKGLKSSYSMANASSSIQLNSKIVDNNNNCGDGGGGGGEEDARDSKKKKATNNTIRKKKEMLNKQYSAGTSYCESSFTNHQSEDDDTTSGKLAGIKQRLKSTRCSIKLNAYAKLYIIIATFCILWLPFCILWPINSVCETCISPFVYQLTYWMGYVQSLINPILLLILNPNYNKLKADT